jgi:hypothetical protein
VIPRLSLVLLPLLQTAAQVPAASADEVLKAEIARRAAQKQEPDNIVVKGPHIAEIDNFEAGVDRLTPGRAGRFWNGDAWFRFADESLNSRNPFSNARRPYQFRSGGGTISGSFTDRLSATFSGFYEATDGLGYINAKTVSLDNLEILSVRDVIATPKVYSEWTPRFDYELTPWQRVFFQFRRRQEQLENDGVGGLKLETTGVSRSKHGWFGSLGLVSNWNPRLQTETRVSFTLDTERSLTVPTAPTLKVLDSFEGVAPQVDRVARRMGTVTGRELISYRRRRQLWQAGIWIRQINVDDVSKLNFNGTILFSGGVGPVLDGAGNPVLGLNRQVTSMERYRRTLYFAQLGLPAAEIRARGGGASQVSINFGDPLASVIQWDYAAFVQHAWQARANLLISTGLRFEKQSNVGDLTNVGPRIGIAYNFKNVVIRAGAGLYHDRYSTGMALDIDRFGNLHQYSLVVRQPNGIILPTQDQIEENLQYATIRLRSPNFRTPRILHTGITAERKLGKSVTASATYYHQRGDRLVRSLSLNTAIPGTGDPEAPGSGQKPLPDKFGNVFAYVSNGRLSRDAGVFSLQRRLGSQFFVSGDYMVSRAASDTDGVDTFPSDPRNLKSEYGRSNLDIRHQMAVTGQWDSRWGLSILAAVGARAGVPFNITTGRDVYGDGQFVERPGIGTGPGGDFVNTRFGWLNPFPAYTDPRVPRNAGTGPVNWVFNPRVTKSIPLGEFGGGGSAGFWRDWVRTPVGARRRLDLIITAWNATNHVNLDKPVGNMSSSFFDQSTALADGYGGLFRSGGNRILRLELRLTY